MSQGRLDELVTALASTRPVLDDITRARIAAVVTAERRDPRSISFAQWSASPLYRRRWMIGGAAGAVRRI